MKNVRLLFHIKAKVDIIIYKSHILNIGSEMIHQIKVKIIIGDESDIDR